MIRLAILGAFVVFAASSQPAWSQSFQPDWSALASDRTALRVGDSLTIVILETASATNSAQSSSRRTSSVEGGVRINSGARDGAGLDLDGGFDGRGQSTRSGRLIGQISVVVEEVLPNGDLRVAGRQVLAIDGERTRIQLSGRVRRADISSGNAVLSSRLSEAEILYDGDGRVSRGASPGVVARVLSFLGLS